MKELTGDMLSSAGSSMCEVTIQSRLGIQLNYEPDID